MLTQMERIAKINGLDLDFSGFQRTWVTHVPDFWHNPRLQK
jgi:hypothetical protein